jgi:hypothetical protein
MGLRPTKDDENHGEWLRSYPLWRVETARSLIRDALIWTNKWEFSFREEGR